MDKNKKFIIHRAANSMKDDHYNMGKAWKQVKGRSINKSNRFIALRVIKYAACALLMIGITVYLMHNNTTETKITKSASLQPGKNECSQVRLVLANGEEIRLSKKQKTIKVEKLGMSFTRDSVNGQLQYRNSIDSLNGEIELRYNELHVPKGADFYLKLPDGSIVNINSESKLRFPVQFSSHSREVYLEGEAFFQVAKDSTAPFTVHAGGKDIIVLGTKFNVSAYNDDSKWITTLVEGKVMVTQQDRNDILHPSEQLTVHKETNIVETRTVDTELYTSWIDGKFYFKGYRFEDIVKKLERWYDFKMIYRDEEIKDMTFRGTIDKHQPLEQLLRYLEETTNIHFNIQDKTITVSRTD